MKIMHIGHLNVPKPEMNDETSFHDIQLKLYLHYSRQIENEGPGAGALKALEEDPRAQALQGQLISYGNRASIFEITKLAMWYLWATHEFGSTVAERNLNKFLDSENIPVVNILWVLGIEVDKTIELKNGIRIISIKEMPDSPEKEHFLKDESLDRYGFLNVLPMPKAAITYTCEVKKISNPETSDREKDKHFMTFSNPLYYVALLLNTVNGVSCIPFYSTSYSSREMPMGMFCGRSGSAPLHEIWGSKSSKLSASNALDLNELLDAFNALSPENRIRMNRIISRLSQAKRRVQIEDKILDLGIALEMDILDDNKKNDQLSLWFRLRGSWFIGSTNQERQDIYYKLKELYDYRSQVGHSGVLCGNNKNKIGKVIANWETYVSLAEQIICKLIYNNKPDWTKIILGEIE